MSQVMLTMAMSLDGFITGPNDDAQNPAGINGMRLMDWLGGDSGNDPGDYRPSDPNSQIVYDEAMSTGAVITGRRTGDFAGYWGGDHHDGVRSSSPPIRRRRTTRSNESTTSPTASRRACSKPKPRPATATATLHGAYTGQECLKAGVLDVIEIQLRPVLLGQGRRLFDNLPPEHIELNLVRTLVRTLEAHRTLHLRYQVQRHP